MVVVVVSTGSGPPPTLDSPLSLSSIRSSSLRLSSTRPAHSSVLLHSSLFFSPRVLCISSTFSLFSLDSTSVLPSCISFSSFLSHALSPPPSLPSSLHRHFILLLVFHFAIFVQIYVELGCLRYQPLTTSPHRYRALEFLGHSAMQHTHHPTHCRQQGISKVKTARCKIHFYLYHFFFWTLPLPPISSPIDFPFRSFRQRHSRELQLSRCIQTDAERSVSDRSRAQNKKKIVSNVTLGLIWEFWLNRDLNKFLGDFNLNCKK